MTYHKFLVTLLQIFMLMIHAFIINIYTKNIQKIETILNKEFSSLCEWFIDNKLPIPFWEDKKINSFY